VNTTINVTDFATIVGPLLVIGGILKNSFPNLPNRVIPGITWFLGVLGYQALTDGWTNGPSWVAAVIASATATGTHSAVKNTVQPTERAKRVPVKVLFLFLVPALFLNACASVKQKASVTTTDPKTGIVETREVSSSVTATGDAKSAVEKMSGGATTKSAHIGASGVSEESNVTEMLKAFGEVLSQTFNAGVSAGKKGIVP